MSYIRLSIYFNEVKNRTVREVGDLIGGKVKVNVDNGTFTNACALRLSYAFNKAGYTIRPSDGAASSGDDKKWYLYRVSDMIQYVKKNSKKTIKGNALSEFKNQKGVIVFGECNWIDATGHVDLFNGLTVEGSDYAGNPCKSITLYVL